MKAIPNQRQGLQEPSSSRRAVRVIPQAIRLEIRLHQGGDFFNGHGSQIVLVDADRLGIGEEFRIILAVIEDGVGLVDPLQGEGLNQLLPGVKLAVIAA